MSGGEESEKASLTTALCGVSKGTGVVGNAGKQDSQQLISCCMHYSLSNSDVRSYLVLILIRIGQTSAVIADVVHQAEIR